VSLATYTEETENKKTLNFDMFIRLAKSLFKSPTGLFGFVILLVVILIAVFANVLAPHDPIKVDPANSLIPPVWQSDGTSQHILGTDNLGRDILSRVLVGSRVSLIVGFFSVILAGVIGLIIGLVAGFYGGWIDNILMRIVDSFLSIPSILFVLVLLAVFNPSVTVLVIVIGITNWVIYARMARGEALSIKEKDFVKASRAIGTKNGTIMFKHILPNLMPSFIVISALSVATTIILESSLSFLGLGIQPPDISWGAMLTDGRDYMATNWWLSTFPGLAITITVLGIMFLGDWLRDVLDPKS